MWCSTSSGSRSPLRQSHRPWRHRYVRWSVYAIAGALLWLIFAPAALGGRLTLVTVDGRSMEPLLVTGDLAVMAAKPSYSEGDLVVFEIGRGSRVIHRLVDRLPDGTWKTRGDNKPAEDPWTIRSEQIKGTMLVTVPRAGAALHWLQVQPLAIGAAAGLAVMAMFVPWRRVRRRPVAADVVADVVAESIPRRDAWVISLMCLLGGTSCALIALVLVRSGTPILSPAPLGLSVGAVLSVVLGTLLLTELLDEKPVP